ncbi:FAD-binding oxidoreductase [Aureimonas sp. AU12]|uniref:FAD-binding oxidoreductase n=1 Tax=Aureimonas sp. AU12 TaxID=1638161 RepID=UPI0009E9973D|nr:FAD-binding oxidoreductase [Aureimonas sp. AU12]
MSNSDASWGRTAPTNVTRATLRTEAGDGFAAVRSPNGLLPRGNGRSYGDSGLNDAGLLIDRRAGAAIHRFDPLTGLVEVDAGVLLPEIVRIAAPQGWFLPVTPGTQFVTMGGALANDVHGKNHHRRGTLGRAIESFTLHRSDRAEPLRCSRTTNADFFAATIGGLGLTGLVGRITLRLMPVSSLTIRETTLRFDRLADYFDAAEEADSRHEYAVAWIDSLASGDAFGRGHLIAGDHAPDGDRSGIARPALASVPFTPPISPLKGLALRAFNEMYFRKARAGTTRRDVPFDGFFYPLDRIGAWNRLYGPSGLHQHQSVVPAEVAPQAVRALMECARSHKQGSFLTVLKRFGALESPGLLSFPRPGYTLTLDFPHRGERTLRLLAELDRITVAAGGAVNPYKDARMSPETFAASFPNWERLERLRDPALMSDFWRRTAGQLRPSKSVTSAAA